jgi:GxxExxY protein
MTAKQLGSEEHLNSLSERVIACAFSVSNVLGCGFLEKVYDNALAMSFATIG